jgi:sterol desaturase/sphingolipid hydroxylase (fatty acid hydroxylase superfamily)
MSYSLFSPQGFLKGYQRHKLSSKLYMSFSLEKVFLILVYTEAIIKMCYNFLLLFPSGFEEFLVAFTLLFFLVFILQEFLEEQ